MKSSYNETLEEVVLRRQAKEKIGMINTAYFQGNEAMENVLCT